MVKVCECFCAPFLRTNRVTVEFDKLYDPDFMIHETWNKNL